MGKQAQEKPQARQRKHSRRWPWIVGGVLVLIILVVTLLIPAVLSSGGFTRWVQAKISSSTGGQANIGGLSVGWLSGVRVANFSFRGPNGWAQVDIDRITARPSYSSLLGGTLAVDRAEIDQPHIAVDLRARPPSTSSGDATDMNDLSRIKDLVVRNGTVQLTSTAGQTVKIADLNSDVSVRPPGRTSRFSVNMAVAQAKRPAEVRASGQVTPSAKTGWNLRGTTGDVSVDVNALNLASIAPLLEMAGVQVQARGQLTGNITTAIQNGQIQNVNASIHGQNVDITGPALKGDRLQTARLEVRADLAQAGDTIDVNQLNIQTDWANVSAAGKFPKTARSLAQLTESGAAYDLTGNFDVNLASLLSQMPNTLGVRPGMQITGGKATGNISTITEAGRPTLVAKAQVAGLTGAIDGKKLNLSQPMQATARLSSGKQGAQLEDLNVSTSFAKINASGNVKQIEYDGQVNLQVLQSELGAFISLGRYQIAGQLASTGQVSIGDKTTDLVGSLQARQLVLAADGNSVSTPQATADFALGLNRQQQAMSIDTLSADTGFGTINVNKATIPLAQGSPTPLNLKVAVDKLDLSKIKPYASFFASFPRDLTLGGIAQSQVNVAQDKGGYHISSNATRIQNFRLVSVGKEPFQQPEVTAIFDVYADPTQKLINRASWQVRVSPEITLKGQLTQTSQANTIKAQGTLDGQVDWATVAPLMSGLVPGQLSIGGRRQISANFESTYHRNDPNAMLANLTGKASLGFDRAAYMGLDVGPADINIQVDNGLMRIGPVSTTVNNGKLDFVGQANLREKSIVLTVPSPAHVVQGVQINKETTEKLLKYVNPIFADAVSVAGIASFDLQQLAMPLTSGARTGTQLTGTLSINQLQLGASNILNQILSVSGQSIRGQMMTIHPTNLVLQNGVVRYEDMQIDVGNNPINFRGSVGLNGALNMTVVLPYTLEGRTVRVGQQVPVSERIAVPLTGTISKPELNLQKLLQLQLQGQIFKGLQDLLQKR
jgi:hypothetical protein